MHKKGGKPHRLGHKDYVYQLVEHTHAQKQEPLDIILTEYVEGYGEEGEKLSLKRGLAYNSFLLPKLAVYASPENMEKYFIEKSDQKKTYSSLNVPLTMKQLQQGCVRICMSIQNPWVLERWHVRANFRKSGIIISNDDCITLPKTQIAGPNLDNQGKEFYVTICINKTESVAVRCRLHHDTYDISQELTLLPDYWNKPGEPLFPEDKEFLNSLPVPTDYLPRKVRK